MGRALEHAAELLRRRGMVVLMSDLLVPPDRSASGRWRRCGRPGTRWWCSSCWTRRSGAWPLDGPTLLRDLESDGCCTWTPPPRGPAYQRALERHLEAVAALCARLGVDRHLFLTDRPLDSALLEFLGERAQRGKRRR